MSETEFNKAAELIKKLKTRPSDDELLQIYALFKQATVGDCNTDKPGLLDLKGKYKWEAWNARKGLTKENARKEYIAVAQEMATKYGV